MAYGAAPTEAGGDKLHFLTLDDNTPAGWFGVDTGVTGTGANTVAFAAIATHVHDDAAGSPGGLSTSSVPLVLVGGVRDDVLGGLTPAAGDAVYLLVDANGALWTHDNALDAALDGTELQVDIVTMPAVDTELAAAVAASDALANPTVPQVLSHLMGWNSATWDRLVSSIAQGLEVDVTRVQGNVAVTHTGLTDLAAAINANRMDVNLEASIALDVSAATVTVDTELAAAAALADATANPTVPAVGSFLHGYNGATWDRLVSSIAQGLEVDVTHVIPGVAADDLGKAIDDSAGATDTGVALLGVHSSDATHLVTAEGDYDVVRLSDFGAFLTAPEQHAILDSLNATAGWAALTNDTLNLATTTKHALGTLALIFDKVDGAANTIFAGIEKTIGAVDLGTVSPHDLIQTSIYIPDLTNVAYVFVRVGTDASNYNEWRVEDTALTAATFETLIFNIGDVNHAGITGNGYDPSAITYIAVGVAFDAETNTLVGIIFDQLSFHTNQHTSAELNAEVSSSVSSANVNLQKVGGSATDKGAGNASNGSQRMVIASDDVLTLAIKNAIEGTLTVQEAAAMDVSAATVTVDNAGTFVVQADGSVAHDALDSGGAGPVKIGGRAQSSEAQPEEVADNDRVDALFDRSGYLRVRGDFDPQFADVEDSVNGNNTIVAAQAAGKRIAVWSILLVADGTVDVRWEDGAGGTAFTGQIPLQAREGYSISAGGIVPLFIGSAATLLNLELNANIVVHGFVSYTVMDD